VIVAVGCAPAVREAPLPPDLYGTLVYVSNHPGSHTLFVRRLPKGPERRLTAFDEDTLEPALSPDAKRVAFSMGGRIGVASVDTGQVSFLTLGQLWKDSAPCFLADGERIVVVSRRSAADKADLHLLSPPAPGFVEARREPLLETPLLEEEAPAAGPDGDLVVFVRDDQLFRLDLATRSVERLTSGFRTRRCPHFVTPRRLVVLFSEGKRHGIELLDVDGENHATLWEGTVYYRHLTPSPDGRYLAATFAFDVGSDPTRLLQLREELRLLSDMGEPLGVLERSPLHEYHSAAWGP
jgi:Tol biopolymer transport system component